MSELQKGNFAWLLQTFDVNKPGQLFFSVRKEFLKVADLLQLELTEVTDRMTFLERYIPNIYKSWFSQMVKKVVRHK